ncbi:MAG: hypothetical protein ACI9Y1_001115 [Lentisphaeria bacterium]|jgi:uncharacterized protein YdgA (DUF945 family)
MNKKLLGAGIAVVLIIAVLMPLLVGNRVKSVTEEHVSKLNSLPGYSAELISYQKGYLSSQAQIKLAYPALNPPEQAQQDAEPSEAWFTIVKEGVFVDVDIQHGPIHQAGIGLFSADIHFSQNQEFVAKAQAFLGSDYLFNTFMYMGFAGSGTARTRISPFTVSEEGGAKTASFAGASIDTQLDAFGKSYQFSGEIGVFSGKTPDASVEVQASTISGNGLIEESLMWSTGNIEIQMPGFRVDGEQAVLMQNLKLVVAVAKPKEPLMEVTYGFNAERLDLPDLALKNAALNIVLKNLKQEALTEFSQLSEKLSQSEPGEDESLQGDMQAALADLLSESPELVVETLAFELGEDFFELSANLGLDSAMVTDPSALQNPFLLIPALRAQLKADFSEDMLQKTIGKYQVSQIEAQVAQFKLTEEDRRVMLEQQPEQLEAMKAQFLELGYLAKSERGLAADARFVQGELSVSGKLVPFPM